MSNQLERFIKDNREDFDKFEPGPVVWHNIAQELRKPQQRKGIMISMRVLRWSAAACVLILAGVGGWYFLKSSPAEQQQIVAAPVQKKTNDLPARVHTDTQSATDPAPLDNQPKEQITDQPDQQLAAKPSEPVSTDDNTELAHYAALVEIKQNQIKKIKKDEPLLYQKFAGDFQKLDSTFHTLKKQLPVNPNREQLLEAMIQNLQLQTELLNQQLNIIKQINHSKKSAYEKAYKSA